MNPTKLKEISELVSQLNEASDAYYNGRGEKMTDYEWDAAFDRLKQLEAETGVILPQSPTHRVSADRSKGGPRVSCLVSRQDEEGGGLGQVE